MPPKTLHFLAATRGGAACLPVAIGMDDGVLMTCISGTTGLPKGAMLGDDNALYKNAAAADCNGVTATGVLLAIVPFHHITSMVMGIDVTVYAGATAVLMYRFDPLAVL